MRGDSRAAVVVSSSPLLVACYCEDLDGVCVLQFDKSLVSEYDLNVGSRLLLSLKLYVSDDPTYLAPDIVGKTPADSSYVNFWPVVADFVSDDTSRIATRKNEISESEYARCQAMGEAHLLTFGLAARDGRPDRSDRPCFIEFLPQTETMAQQPSEFEPLLLKQGDQPTTETDPSIWRRISFFASRYLKLWMLICPVIIFFLGKELSPESIGMLFWPLVILFLASLFFGLGYYCFTAMGKLRYVAIPLLLVVVLLIAAAGIGSFFFE